MLCRLAFYVHAAIRESQAVRNFVGEDDFFPRGRSCFIIRQLHRIGQGIAYIGGFGVRRLFNGRDRITVRVLINDRADIARYSYAGMTLGELSSLPAVVTVSASSFAVLVYEFFNDDVVNTVIVAEAVPFFRAVRNAGFYQIAVTPVILKPDHCTDIRCPARFSLSSVTLRLIIPFTSRTTSARLIGSSGRKLPSG